MVAWDTGNLNDPRMVEINHIQNLYFTFLACFYKAHDTHLNG